MLGVQVVATVVVMKVIGVIVSRASLLPLPGARGLDTPDFCYLEMKV